MQTRRDILRGSAAVAAAAVLPAVPISAAVLAEVVPAAPPLLGWSIGTEGSMDWEAVFAPTKEEAVKEWLSIKGTCDGCPHDTGENDVCECYPDIMGHRSPAFDAHVNAAAVPDIAKHEDGWCNIECDRCGNTSDETTSWDVNRVIGSEIVCEDCMTLADWKVDDPEHYEMLVDDLLTEEYGEAVTQ